MRRNGTTPQTKEQRYDVYADVHADVYADVHRNLLQLRFQRALQPAPHGRTLIGLPLVRSSASPGGTRHSHPVRIRTSSGEDPAPGAKRIGCLKTFEGC
ncbi:hypothetical protein EYF80_031900 [Liparis tanakae]|uniref:Uncharacterized protein n=1 Tax=Liparis tanakae TaxID=230148 RepID=A0A4Z2GX65_9TELE|nr:hypothetical protein EYF80_031900 [Liparis tanakae]